MFQLLAIIIGFIVFLTGIVLGIGNHTGLYPTFPFAGLITIVAGAALIGAGTPRPPADGGSRQV